MRSTLLFDGRQALPDAVIDLRVFGEDAGPTGHAL